MTWCGNIRNICAAAVLGLVFAQAPVRAGISLDAAVDRAEITIGDPVRFDITIKHSPDLELYLPGLNIPLGGFEIRDYKSDDRTDEKTGEKQTGIHYVITTYSTGDFTIPPVQVAYRSKSDSSGGTVSGDSIKIAVKSIKPSEAEDIQDLKGQANIPAGPLRWILLGAGLLAAAGFCLYWFHFRPKWLKRKEEGPETSEPLRPAHEIAREELDALAAEGLPDKAGMDAYHTRLSEIIRAYTGRRYGIHTLERTTWEIMEQLERKNGEEALPVSAFGDFFNDCDMVKFAKDRPTAEIADTNLTRGRELVDGTRQVETAAPATGGDNA